MYTNQMGKNVYRKNLNIAYPKQNCYDFSHNFQKFQFVKCPFIESQLSYTKLYIYLCDQIYKYYKSF